MSGCDKTCELLFKLMVMDQFLHLCNKDLT